MATEPGAELTAALRDPAAYPHHVDHIDVIQTHISQLFFAGPFVYKVKRPIRTGFLDYSTLDRRRHYCEEEARLNRRLAPDVYLGVVPIARDAAGAVRVEGEGDGGEGEAIEYAVKMRRLPAERMLDVMLQGGEATADDLDRIVDVIARFHREAPAGPDVDAFAAPAALRRQIDDNLAELRRIADEARPRLPMPPALVEHVHAWLTAFIRHEGPRLQSRLGTGRIREGHGDLHAGNICLPDDRIVIYDCIEFSRAFRCRDVAAELAFLAMDLDRRGFRAEADHVIERYAQQMNDGDLPDLATFYKTHYAIVRCKVNAMQAADAQREAAEQQRRADDAAGYLHLAVGYTLGPALLLMCGLPATGKSHIARALARPLNAVHLRSDAIRKGLAGLEPSERGGEDLYTDDMTQRTYDAMHREAEHALRNGRIVIADATFPTEQRRRAFINLARRLHMPWLIVHTAAPDAVIEQRMHERAKDAREVSDADLRVYRAMKARFEPLDESAAAHVLTTGTDMTDADAVSAALARLIDTAATD